MKILPLLTAALFGASAASAEDVTFDASKLPAPVSVEQLEEGVPEGYTALFQNDSLKGWEKKGGQEAKFKLDDGVLTGSAKNMRHNSFLCSEKLYGDFIIVFQMKFVHLDGNSGLMFRAVEREEDGRVSGYQCEHDNTKRSWTAGLFDEARRGWLFPAQKSDKRRDQIHRDLFTGQGTRIFKPKDWNTIVIRCEGNRIQTWMNGELRVNFVDEDPEHSTAEGFFGFQVHNGKSCEVQWRNVAIKEL